MRPARTRSSARPSRRQFIASSLGTAAALAVAGPPSRAFALQRPRATVPADRPLRLAFAGIGNRGLEMIKTFATTGLTTVTALCDVDLDSPLTREARDLHSSAPRFRDARRMIDEAGSTFDAIVIATPDHSHFPLAVHAMAAGKHVYLEKPMARTFQEVELLMALAGDACIVIGGRAGTKSEVHLAWLHRRPLLPLVGCGGWSDELPAHPPDERGHAPILPWASVAELVARLAELGLARR